MANSNSENPHVGRKFQEQRVKNLFKGYKNLTGAVRQELQRLAVEITEEGKEDISFVENYIFNPNRFLIAEKPGSNF